MDGQGGRILLLEDHADTARVFSALLTQDGFDVAIARSLAEARTICANGSFDLMICDIQLPDGDGVTALQAARETCPDVAGIVVTGHDQPAFREAARRAGFLNYLIKPLAYATLKAAVDRALPGSAASGPALIAT